MKIQTHIFIQRMKMFDAQQLICQILKWTAVWRLLWLLTKEMRTQETMTILRICLSIELTLRSQDTRPWDCDMTVERKSSWHHRILVGQTRPLPPGVISHGLTLVHPTSQATVARRTDDAHLVGVDRPRGDGGHWGQSSVDGDYGSQVRDSRSSQLHRPARHNAVSLFSRVALHTLCDQLSVTYFLARAIVDL